MVLQKLLMAMEVEQYKFTFQLHFDKKVVRKQTYAWKKERKKEVDLNLKS